MQGKATNDHLLPLGNWSTVFMQSAILMILTHFAIPYWPTLSRSPSKVDKFDSDILAGESMNPKPFIFSLMKTLILW